MKVVVAFVISAWLTFAFYGFTFFFIKDGFPEDQLNELDLQHIRVVQAVRNFILHKVMRIRTKPSRPEVAINAIENIAILLSDQQLITGMAILVAIFIRHCTITQYHFYLASILAQVSFVTHFCAALLVRNTYLERPIMKYTRLFFIALTLVLLCVTQSVINYDSFMLEYGLPTQCVWDDHSGYSGMDFLVHVQRTPPDLEHGCYTWNAGPFAFQLSGVDRGLLGPFLRHAVFSLRQLTPADQIVDRGLVYDYPHSF